MISPPTYSTAIMIKVKGISLDLIFENELNKISIKAIPLPPISEFENKTAFSNAVDIAVTKIISESLPELYFSSSKGPRRRMTIIFPIR